MLGLEQLLTTTIALTEQIALKELLPVFNDFKITQLLCLWRVDMQHHMVVIRHHGIGGDVDTKDFRQSESFILNPATAVFKTLPTEKSSAYTACNTMIVGGSLQGNLLASGLGHGGYLCKLNDVTSVWSRASYY